MLQSNRAASARREELWKCQKAARFPHSHSSGDEDGWKVENQRQVSAFHPASIPLSLTTPVRGRASPPRAGDAAVLPFCSAEVGNFHSALDKGNGENARRSNGSTLA